MADIYKCTKVTNMGESLVVTNAITFKVDFTDPTTSPPTPGSVTVNLDKSIAAEASELQDEVDEILELLTSNAMNWSL
jgi:hypothetical protein